MRFALRVLVGEFMRANYRVAMRAAIGTSHMRFAVRKSIAKALRVREQDVQVSETAVVDGRRLAQNPLPANTSANTTALEISAQFTIQVAEPGEGVSDESVVMDRVSKLGNVSSEENIQFRSALVPSMEAQAADEAQAIGFAMLSKSVEPNSIHVLEVDAPKVVEEVDSAVGKEEWHTSPSPSSTIRGLPLAMFILTQFVVLM